MYQVLKLNATYEPLDIVSWKSAMSMIFSGKVEVIEEYDAEVHTVNLSFKIPSVIRLLYFVKQKVRVNKIRFNKNNVLARDGYKCQYCGKRYFADDLTLDHILPRCRGGLDSWDNVVTSCKECNNTKGDRTPEEAGMKLLRKPVEPSWFSSFVACFNHRSAYDRWVNYLILK